MWKSYFWLKREKTSRLVNREADTSKEEQIKRNIDVYYEYCISLEKRKAYTCNFLNKKKPLIKQKSEGLYQNIQKNNQPSDKAADSENLRDTLKSRLIENLRLDSSEEILFMEKEIKRYAFFLVNREDNRTIRQILVDGRKDVLSFINDLNNRKVTSGLNFKNNHEFTTELHRLESCKGNRLKNENKIDKIKRYWQSLSCKGHLNEFLMLFNSKIVTTSDAYKLFKKLDELKVPCDTSKILKQ